jgi:ABC-type arginine transport system permease subunit
MEKTPADRRFRNLILGLIILLAIIYGAYKVQLITTAFNAWEGQRVEDSQGLAAK